MSTQDSQASVPISILPQTELQHFRLLELPAELLALLTSGDAPRLELKSREVTDGATNDANAVLCTFDKTYNIRQVSTSNEVYITQPREEAYDSGGPPTLGLEAIAKCDSTLELIPASRQSAVSYIKATLPIYSSTGNYGTSKVASKAELYSHIPLSQAECDEGWSELACFESSNPAGCFIPHAKVRAQIWETALTAAVAEGASLNDPFPADDIPAFALDLRDDWPLEVLASIFASISIRTQGDNLAIDKDKCVRVVGLNLLEAKSGGRPIDKHAFLQAWKDAVPETWRVNCELTLLKGAHDPQDTTGSITFVDPRAAIVGAGETATEAKSTLGAKRKWHEKFRPQKKTA